MATTLYTFDDDTDNHNINTAGNYFNLTNRGKALGYKRNILICNYLHLKSEFKAGYLYPTVRATRICYLIGCYTIANPFYQQLIAVVTKSTL